MSLRRRLIYVCFLIWLSCFACGFSGATNQPKINIFVSIVPQAYFAERIGGELVDVGILVGPGQSPATYEPTPKQMSLLFESDLYFSIGVPFEKRLLEKLSKSKTNLSIIDCGRGIELRPMGEQHKHGDHYHGATDPHLWMNPQLAKMVSENIFKDLARLSPLNEDKFRSNLKQLHDELNQLDNDLSNILAPFAGRSFLIFHPVLGYFSERYRLNQIAVETEGKEPGAQQLVELIAMAEEENIKTVLVQPQFSSKSAERIAESINGRVVEIDPLAYDYINNLKTIAGKIAEGFQYK